MVSSGTPDKSNLLLPIAVVAALIPIVGGAWWYLDHSEPARATAPVLTGDAKAYTKNLKLSGVEMKATANYTGAPLVEILGSITNAGDRSLSRVELNCIFYDNVGQVVLRERVPIVKQALRPGAATSFRLPFEGLPDSWSKQMPQLVIAQILFAP